MYHIRRSCEWVLTCHASSTHDVEQSPPPYYICLLIVFVLLAVVSRNLFYLKKKKIFYLKKKKKKERKRLEIVGMWHDVWYDSLASTKFRAETHHTHTPYLTLPAMPCLTSPQWFLVSWVELSWAELWQWDQSIIIQKPSQTSNHISYIQLIGRSN